MIRKFRLWLCKLLTVWSWAVCPEPERTIYKYINDQGFRSVKNKLDNQDQNQPNQLFTPLNHSNLNCVIMKKQ